MLGSNGIGSTLHGWGCRAVSAPTPAVLRHDPQAAYRKLAELEHMLADVRADLAEQRRRVAALEHIAHGLAQQ